MKKIISILVFSLILTGCFETKDVTDQADSEPVLWEVEQATETVPTEETMMDNNASQTIGESEDIKEEPISDVSVSLSDDWVSVSVENTPPTDNTSPSNAEASAPSMQTIPAPESDSNSNENTVSVQGESEISINSWDVSVSTWGDVDVTAWETKVTVTEGQDESEEIAELIDGFLEIMDDVEGDIDVE